jgi:hypothetical protein
MEIDKALEQLEEIHNHVHRSEVYRGYRSILTAAMGLVALGAAFLQARFVMPGHPLSFVYFWVTVGAVNFILPVSQILFHYLAYESPLERKKTRMALGQFLPCLLAGAFLTFAVCKTDEGFIVFLPGLWSILFGMGVYASKPYLPGAIHWMAASFFTGGVILLAMVPSGQSLSPWGMGIDFSLGLLAGAWILYFNLERKKS